ncbi:aftiphilin isoform X2 [Lissotriton helveticus]
MEPDIIRMYSSSPPPLDNGAEDEDEDEFGEFGGFAEVEGSCVEFADFDAPDYSNSKEDFIPPNHFMPIQDYSDVNSYSSTEINENCFPKFSDSPMGQCDLLETDTCIESIQSRTSNSAFQGKTSPEYVRKKVQEKEQFVKQEHISPEVIRPQVNQEIRNCNGNKLPCPEVLTNGFAVLDSVNPQGTEALDVDSNAKGIKTISSHSTELDSVSRPKTVFDLTTFSSKNTEETEDQAHLELDDAVLPKSQDNCLINRVNDRSTGIVLNSTTSEDQPELEAPQLGFSDANAVCLAAELQGEHNSASLQCETVVSSSTLPASLGSATNHRLEDIGKTEKSNTGHKVREAINVDVSRTCSSTEMVNDHSITIHEEHRLEQNEARDSVCTNKDSLDDFGGLTNNDHSTEFATFPVSNTKDFDQVSTMPPSLVCDIPEPNGFMFLESTSEQFPQFTKTVEEFGEFGNVSTTLEPECTGLDPSKETKVGALSDLDSTQGMFCDFPAKPFAEVEKDDLEFGDYDSVPKTQEVKDAFQEFDDFADFSSASYNQPEGWNAFEDEQKGSSWTAFGDEPAVDSFICEEEPRQPHRTEVPIESESGTANKGTVLSSSDKTELTGHEQEAAAAFQTSLIGRLERIFQVCFPAIPVSEEQKTITTLQVFLEDGGKQAKQQEKSGEGPVGNRKKLNMWMELQNVHDGYGLRYQWGGSHSNKMLLCSLGIDTRNILFTGNKKQPVIVPMYASGLGMLEPTKEPLKPVSAAEKITSIGHTPPVSPEITPSDQLQESLPPVQFDWSTSGLTNPLDGVDPELYELTTSKMESSNTSNKVTDAFAKLMSTVEKTSTSTRKPKKEERLSEEAAKVIASLPDLSFMHAKVLMFPATLTPATSCQEKVD